jgi:uncharacterized protein (DUF1330 family)
MKSQYKVTLAMLAGVGIGAVAVHGLHAQAKPPVYFISEIDVSNPDAYAKEFVPKAQAGIKAAGGRALAAGSKVTTIEGAPPKGRVVLMQWDSMEKIQAWLNDPEQQTLRKNVGDKYATFRSFTVEGVPN